MERRPISLKHPSESDKCRFNSHCHWFRSLSIIRLNFSQFRDVLPLNFEIHKEILKPCPKLKGRLTRLKVVPTKICNPSWICTYGRFATNVLSMCASLCPTQRRNSSRMVRLKTVNHKQGLWFNYLKILIRFNCNLILSLHYLIPIRWLVLLSGLDSPFFKHNFRGVVKFPDNGDLNRRIFFLNWNLWPQKVDQNSVDLRTGVDPHRLALHSTLFVVGYCSRI